MPDFPQATLGAFLLVLGLLGAVYPYTLARFEEQLDAIGSKRRWSEVEPADWKVALTRIGGAVVALFGTVVLAVGLLA